MSRATLYQIYRSEAVKRSLEEVFDSGDWWLYKGKRAKALENAFAEFHGAKYGISLSSGTIALEIALRCLQTGPGDEIILPAYDFYSLPKSVTNTGATPVFCDVKAGNFTLDVEAVKEAITPHTKAIVAVHISSAVAEMDALRALADAHGIYLIEDCAQAHGATYDGQRVGSFGHISLFSFGGIKLMTSGQGGILVTSDSELYDRAFALVNRGMLANGTMNDFDIIGGNFQLSELQASVLLPQLKALENYCRKREKAMRYLDEELEFIEGIQTIQQFDKTGIRAQMAYSFCLDESILGPGNHREKLTELLWKKGFPVYRGYSAIGQDERLQDQYSSSASAFPNAEYAGRNIISIRHPLLLESLDEVHKVVAEIYQFVTEPVVE